MIDKRVAVELHVKNTFVSAAFKVARRKLPVPFQQSLKVSVFGLGIGSGAVYGGQIHLPVGAFVT